MRSPQPAKRLGQLLVERRLVTPAQLDQALARQRATKEFVGRILVQLGFLTPDALTTTLSEQFGIPWERLTVDRVDWTIIKQFPRAILADGRCFPIRADAESVTVAIVDPLEVWALGAIEKAANFRTVKVVLVTEQDLHAVVASYQRQALQSIEARLRDGPKTQ